MRKRTTRSCFLLLTRVLIVFIFTLLLSSGVSAQQSTLEQQIVEPDCTIVGQCVMSPPIVKSVDSNSRKPIIRGSYHAAYSKQLRVNFGDRLYILGVDQQLTSSEDLWVLDLSGLLQSLLEGEYELVVEAEGYDGTIKRIAMEVVMRTESAKIIDSTIKTTTATASTTIADTATETSTDTSAGSPEKNSVGQGSSGTENIPKPIPPEESKPVMSPVEVIAVLGATTIGAIVLVKVVPLVLGKI